MVHSWSEKVFETGRYLTRLPRGSPSAPCTLVIQICGRGLRDYYMNRLGSYVWARINKLSFLWVSIRRNRFRLVSTPAFDRVVNEIVDHERMIRAIQPAIFRDGFVRVLPSTFLLESAVVLSIFIASIRQWILRAKLGLPLARLSHFLPTRSVSRMQAENVAS